MAVFTNLKADRAHKYSKFMEIIMMEIYVQQNRLPPCLEEGLLCFTVKALFKMKNLNWFSFECLIEHFYKRFLSESRERLFSWAGLSCL